MKFIHDLQGMTPEQRILWNHVRALMARDANDTLTPLFYQGPIAGSEFLTYDATKIYICFEIVATPNAGTYAVGAALITFYNELNAVSNYSMNSPIAWDATAAAMRYGFFPIVEKNLFFSKIVAGTVSHMKFIGYRLNKVA